MSTPAETAPTSDWLKRYYGARALFSALWVTLAFTIGKSSPLAVAVIVAYPAWDSLANYVDAKRNGGLRANPTQLLNVVVSALVAIAVALARDFHGIVAIIGVWAARSGILQLSTAVRRWRSAGAQWPMIVSGAQSALAGVLFVKQGFDASTTVSIATIAPYAAFGAAYFAISAVVLVFRRR
jgi:hypothetical protein